MHRNHPPSPPFLLSIKQRSAIYAPSLPSMESGSRDGLPRAFKSPSLLVVKFFLFSSIVFVTFRTEQISIHFQIYTCIRKFLYVYSIFDECKLAVIIHDDEGGKERKEEREKKNPILLKSHRSIENQVSENLLLSSRTTDALSDPRRVEIHFPPRGSHFFSPFLPLVNPFSPPPLSTAKRGADIADPNYREKNSKRRGAVPRGDAIIFQIGGYPPLFLPPFLNLFSLFFFLTSISLILSLPFLFYSSPQI